MGAGSAGDRRAVVDVPDWADDTGCLLEPELHLASFTIGVRKPLPILSMAELKG